MLEHADRFASLLGAPGYFTESDGSLLASALSGASVFNGVGEEDSESWQEALLATHEALVEIGVDSTYEVFPGQGHIPDESFDASPLFGFWFARGE